LARPSPSPAAWPGRGGNRFDSPDGAYEVLYFASRLEGCFGETLARLRPNPRLVEVIGKDWDGWMTPGAVSADWRHRRLAVRASGPDDAVYLDVEDPDAREHLFGELATYLVPWGYEDLDVAAVRGRDRRVTRLISLWAHQERTAGGAPRYAGIRYLSRLDSAWECWAVFSRTPLEVREALPIGRQMPALQAVAGRFGLTVH